MAAAQRAAASFTVGGGSSRNPAKMEREGESELGEELEEEEARPLLAFIGLGGPGRWRAALRLLRPIMASSGVDRKSVV